MFSAAKFLPSAVEEFEKEFLNPLPRETHCQRHVFKLASFGKPAQSKQFFLSDWATLCLSDYNFE